MSKIGIAIKITSAGSSQPYVVNGGDWTKRVIDVRDILKHVPSMASDHAPMVVFVSYIEDACLITVARTVSGRSWDNVSGWIHIPNNLIISGQEVNSIISKVKNIISAYELPEESELKALFNTEYDTKSVSARYEASKKDGKYAKRSTIVYPLEELLGKYRYQSYYSEYNAVFLVSDTDAITDAVDLSAKPLSALITLIPPTTREIQDKLGRFVTLKLASGQVFNDPILLNKGQTITLTAEREGYEPTSVMVTAESDGQECILPKTEWNKKISKSNFNIKSDSGKNLNDNATIRVNAVDITTRPRTLSEKECESVDVVVSANGYDTFKSKLNLLKNSTISIVLNRRVDEFKKKVYLKNGSTGEISISGKGIDRYESPIKGYVVCDDYLEYMPGNVWLQRLIGFGVAVVIWLIIQFIGWWNSIEFRTSSDFPWIETVSKDAYTSNPEKYLQDNVDNGQNETNSEDASSANNSAKQAIHYLDNENGTWVRDSLIKYPELQGLFEELNTYKFKEILSRQSKLSDSKKFMKVVEAIQANQTKNFGKSYIDYKNDSSITVNKYIKTLNKSEENANQNETPQGASSTQSISNGRDKNTSKPNETNQNQSNSKRGSKGNGNDAPKSGENKFDKGIN